MRDTFNRHRSAAQIVKTAKDRQRAGKGVEALFWLSLQIAGVSYIGKRNGCTSLVSQRVLNLNCLLVNVYCLVILALGSSNHTHFIKGFGLIGTIRNRLLNHLRLVEIIERLLVFLLIP